MEQIFVDNRAFYIPPAFDATVNFNSFEYSQIEAATRMLPLKRGGAKVLRILL